MNRFTADFSSSVNSTDTPPKPRHIFSNIPSLASTTPLAPPPSTIFGSSQVDRNTGVSKLKFSNKPTSATSHFPLSQTIPRTNNGPPARPKTRLSSSNTERVDERTNFQDDEDESMHDDSINHNNQSMMPKSGLYSSNKVSPRQPPAQSLMKFSTNSERQSRMGRSTQKPSLVSRLTQLPRKGDATIVPNLARDLARRASPAPLQEDDEVILQTEQILRHLEDETIGGVADEETLNDIVSRHAHDLLHDWRSYGSIGRPSLESGTIGPPTSSSGFLKANYLASLLLAMHHPPLSSPEDMNSKSIPLSQILLDWLDNYHVSYEQLYRAVISASPNCTSHPLFWDAVQSLTLRGKLSEAMQLLADADFRHAASATDDGADSNGYVGVQLQTIQSVVLRARQIFNVCPAMQESDWEISGQEWDIFRKNVQAELETLTDLAGAGDDDDGDDGESFEAENFGIRKPGFGLLGKTNQKHKKSLPWTIYQSLKITYNILLGSVEEIIAQSSDWLEASLALTAWWDGIESTKIAKWSFDVSKATGTGEDEPYIDPYLTRLRESFLCVTDPKEKDSFQINALSAVEVGMGAILQGSIDGALMILQTLSQCVAAAVAEVASTGNYPEWDALGHASSEELDRQDLMVLGYGEPNTSQISKDDVLLDYSEALFDRPQFQAEDGTVIEGWELGFGVVARFNDVELTTEIIDAQLDRLSVTEEGRAEKLMNLFTDLGRTADTQRVSEKFGDYLVDNTNNNYGTALLCYARSHSEGKIRRLIDMLNGYCLVQSKAYPNNHELDDGLRRLVSSPKTALSDIAEIDPTAAQHLQFYLAGYACLRRFYTLRDQELDASSSSSDKSQKKLRPIYRKRAAANVLVAAINSAADSIYGGLFDAERQSAIQVDALYTLLGEATALLSTSTPGSSFSPISDESNPQIFTTQQLYSLLSAIEDLESVSAQISSISETCLLASLKEYQGTCAIPDPRKMLKKTISSSFALTESSPPSLASHPINNSNSNSGTGTSFSFSLMGSEMLASSAEGVKSGTSDSGVLVQNSQNLRPTNKPMTGSTARGWDWRARVKDPDAKGRDVLMYLRRGIALELAMGGLDE